MRKKIILGIVILAAIVGAVYFDKNYAIVEDKYGTKIIVSIDVTEIRDKKYDLGEPLKCTPSLRKLTKLEKLWLAADEDMNLNYLSEMKGLNELVIFYYDGYCGRLETLPDLPNLKQMDLLGSPDEGWNTFALDEKEYCLSSIDTLVLQLFDIVDFESLKHFENLHTLKILHVRDDAKEDLIKQSEELQEKGIDVEIW